MSVWTSVVLLHLVATWTMVGVIWFVQLVHYPLFAWHESDDFTRFSDEHQRRTSWVVIPPMLLEAGSSLALAYLVLQNGETETARVWVVMGLALLALVWLSTFMLQVPCHRRLSQRDLDADERSRTIRRLVRSNWLRTAGWSLRGLVAVMLLV